MDFDPPERVRWLLPELAELLETVVYPLERRFLASGFAEVEPDLVKLRGEARRMGLWTPQLAREAGGAGLSLIEFAHVAEVLGRSPLAHYVFNCHAPDAGNMEILAEFGSVEQKERYLEPIVAGEQRSCFAMTEPGRPGSNPTWMDTRARPVDGGWAIDGRKWFATGAEGAAFAIVMAVTDPDAERHERASLFLVPTGAAGYRLERKIPVMGHAGDGWTSHGEVVFEDCRVPEDALLGERGEGFRIAQARLGPGRIHHCMRWLGVAQRALDLLCRRAATREVAPGRALGDQQAVRHWIAESWASIRAARLLVLEAAAQIDAGGPGSARREISAIKFHVADVMLAALDRAIQAHGGLGVTDDTPLAWLWRQERAARIYDGPDEVHKTVVGRDLLRDVGGEGER